LAQHTRTSYADARADLRLAESLDRARPLVAAAMREGATTLAQARVIDRALGALPVQVDAETIDLAEAHLVERAGEFGPQELGRIGRRILDVVAPEIAERAEAARLADLEAHAAEQTRLTTRRQGDGTTRLPPGSGPTSKRSPAPATIASRRRPPTRCPGSPTPAGSAERSSSSSRPSTPPACRSTAATPPP